MRIYVRCGNETTESHTCFFALLNWFVDQIEWGRPERLKGQPIETGRTDDEFLVLLVALVERQFGGTIKIPRGVEHEIACTNVLVQLHERHILRVRVEVTGPAQ